MENYLDKEDAQDAKEQNLKKRENNVEDGLFTDEEIDSYNC